MSNSLYYLLNLACIKHTGLDLPCDGEHANLWKYKLEDGKKKGILTIPRNAIMSYDWSNPISHQVSRKLICDAIHDALQHPNWYPNKKIEFGFVEGSIPNTGFSGLVNSIRSGSMMDWMNRKGFDVGVCGG